MSLVRSEARERGICCDSCQEDVNVHACNFCGKRFNDRDIIFCEYHSQTDCMHYHEDCKPKEEK
jgi:hypothetical protein